MRPAVIMREIGKENVTRLGFLKLKHLVRYRNRLGSPGRMSYPAGRAMVFNFTGPCTAVGERATTGGACGTFAGMRWRMDAEKQPRSINGQSASFANGSLNTAVSRGPQWTDTMDKMIEGYRRFLARSWPARQALFQDLAEHGQNPHAMVIACADSRVDPGMIFDAAPGEIFTVRNVANLVPPYAPDGNQHATSAALEFGVRVLRVTDLVVLGHAMCGGVRALLTGAPQDARDFLAP